MYIPVYVVFSAPLGFVLPVFNRRCLDCRLSWSSCLYCEFCVSWVNILGDRTRNGVFRMTQGQNKRKRQMQTDTDINRTEREREKREAERQRSRQTDRERQTERERNRERKRDFHGNIMSSYKSNSIESRRFSHGFTESKRGCRVSAYGSYILRVNGYDVFAYFILIQTSRDHLENVKNNI